MCGDACMQACVYYMTAMCVCMRVWMYAYMCVYYIVCVYEYCMHTQALPYVEL